MPTPNEKKALAFLSAFALLGAGVRVTQAVTRASTGDAASREALRQQIVAAESASAAGRHPRKSVVARRERPRPVTALDSAMTAPSFTSSSYFDTPTPAVTPGRRQGKGSAPLTAPVDVDRASAAELEALPRIGPALAKRIVEDREANGPYGSIDGLRRVKGIGPAVARALAPIVTFSGTPRPSIAGRGGRDRSSGHAPDSWRHPAPP